MPMGTSGIPGCYAGVETRYAVFYYRMISLPVSMTLFWS